jgi:hypothetical protein
MGMTSQEQLRFEMGDEYDEKLADSKAFRRQVDW